MRSWQPIPGNPWPHDMVLTITGDDDGLAELLWVREAWGLSAGGDVPPPVELPVEGVQTVESLRRDKSQWERAWTESWSARLGHVGKAQDHDAFEAMRRAPLGSMERRDLFDALRGPSWRDRFGDAAFDDRYQQWTLRLSALHRSDDRLPLDQHPERRCLDALVPAWERGLTTVVTIPCSGTYTRTIGRSGLCVTRATRFDTERYREALTTFGR
ncbi:hypothetical protein [uncultured Amnibacterium sp.]|uniref:hypothetical protein n=1 Tax=uncultured Amnibacterium sp. TaxID=1631851 RepID=UPI0035C97C9F